MVVDVVQNPQKSNVYEYDKKHVRRDSKMCCCCCCHFCCGDPTTDERIHALVLHDASQIAYCRYWDRAPLPPITSTCLIISPRVSTQSTTNTAGIIRVPPVATPGQLVPTVPTDHQYYSGCLLSGALPAPFENQATSIILIVVNTERRPADMQWKKSKPITTISTYIRVMKAERPQLA